MAAMFGGLLLLASSVISIILLTKEETRVGLAMLLVSIIGAPIVMVVLFLLSNLIFAAIVGSTVEGLSTMPKLR